jgi:LPS-assembly protein
MLRILVTFLLYFICLEAKAANIENQFSVSSNEPVTIEANTLYYNKEKDQAYAKGNVSIEQNDQILYADELTYFRKEDLLYAKGNVVLRRVDGSVFFTDEVKLSKSLMKGIAINFKAKMGVKSLLISSTAELIDENHIEMENMAYTPCKVCENNFIPNVPLWQFRAKKANMDRVAQRIDYEDATIEALGVPVIYTPYLSSPSPGADRKSGFLMPRFLLSSQQLGFSARIPYYLNIAKNMDATITPFFATKASDALFLQFRHKIKQGEYELNGSGTYTTMSSDSPTTDFFGDRKFEGHYDLKGNFTYENHFHRAHIKVKSKRVFDDAKTYLKKYRVNDDQILNTDVSYNVFDNRSYYIFRGLSFQDLRPLHNNKTTPAALPLIDMHYEGDSKTLFSKMHLDVNFLNLSRPQGVNYQRMVTTVALSKQAILPYGQLVKVKGSVRGDVYYTQKKPIIVTDTPAKLNNTLEGYETRGYPELNAEWSLPVYRTFSNGSVLVLEPVVNPIISAYTTNLEKIADEDSKSPEISAYNLFSSNRYKGYDKIESGNRLNYGIRGNLISPWMRNLNFLIGQSVRAKKDYNFQKSSGMDGLRSDYVSKLSLQPTEHVFINNNSRYDEDDLSLQRNELNLDLVFPKYTFNASHTYSNKDILDLSIPRYRQEAAFFATYNLIDDWWLEGAIRTRLGKKIATQPRRMIEDLIGLQYRGDCLYLRFAVSRNYTTIVDLKPETNYMINFNVPIF